jgi:hypothetical protein
MSTLGYSIELLSSLPIRIRYPEEYTVDAGSFFGFGPLFFGAVESDQSFSPFSVAVDIVPAPEGIVVAAVRVACGVSPFETGKGQSLPLYDLESECPHAGATRGVLWSCSWMLCERNSRVVGVLFEKGAMELAAGLLSVASSVPAR